MVQLVLKNKPHLPNCVERLSTHIFCRSVARREGIEVAAISHDCSAKTESLQVWLSLNVF